MGNIDFGNIDINRETILLDAQLQMMDEARFGKVLAQQVRDAQANLDALVARFEENETNTRRYSNDDGYVLRMGEVRQQARAELDNITGTLIAALNKRISELRARLVPDPPTQADMVAIQIERRALLRSLDPMMALAEYFTACSIDDTATWSAVETAASYDPLRAAIKPDDLVAGAKIRAELQYPDVISALKETENVLDALSSSIRGVEKRCGIAVDATLRAAGVANALA